MAWFKKKKETKWGRTGRKKKIHHQLCVSRRLEYLCRCGQTGEEELHREVSRTWFLGTTSRCWQQTEKTKRLLRIINIFNCNNKKRPIHYEATLFHFRMHTRKTFFFKSKNYKVKRLTSLERRRVSQQTHCVFLDCCFFLLPVNTHLPNSSAKINTALKSMLRVTHWIGNLGSRQRLDRHCITGNACLKWPFICVMSPDWKT